MKKINEAMLVNSNEVMPKGTFRGGEQDTEVIPKGTFRGGEQDTEVMPKGTFR